MNQLWVLDTDTVSLIQRGREILRQRLLTTPPERIAVTVITLFEQLRGRLADVNRAREGNLLMVEFEVLANTEGKTSPLVIENVNLSNSLNITMVNGSVTVIPSTFALLQNYPNPFNPETWIPFKIAKDASVTINIYNAKGQLIRAIALGEKAAGVYLSKDKAAYWDGKDDFGEKVGSGVYFYTLQAGEFIATRKLVVVK